jgi:AcrR family transcriptional regulator
MEENRTDLRSVRTDKAIHMAFEQMLMEGQGKESISVTALARRAGINRKTFYLHYDTMTDLVNTYIADARTELLTLLEAHDVEEYLSTRGLLVSVLSQFFAGHQQFYSYVLFQDKYWPRVRGTWEEVNVLMARRLADARNLSFDDALLYVTFSCGTMLTMLRMRLRGQTSFTPEQLREKIVKLNVEGMRGVLDLRI